MGVAPRRVQQEATVRAAATRARRLLPGQLQGTDSAHPVGLALERLARASVAFAPNHTRANWHELWRTRFVHV